ncbi:hypothetical protein Tco_0025672 [Tanacetum coccineum]
MLPSSSSNQSYAFISHLSPPLLPLSSPKRPRSPSPSPPPLVSPSPIPPLPSLPPPAVPPSPEHIDPVRDDIETLRAILASAIRMRWCRSRVARVRARVGLLEQHDVVTQDSLRIARGGSHELRSRAEYAESHLEQSHDRQARDRARTQRTDMIEQDIEASRARVEAAEQRAKTLQVSLGAARIDVRDLIESREADRLEMAELQSQAQNIEASFWDLERRLGL